MSKKFLPVVRALAGQGRLCATPAIVRGNRLQVEVRVYGAQAAALPQEWLLEHANNALSPQPVTAADIRPAVIRSDSAGAAASVTSTPSRSGLRSQDFQSAPAQAESAVRTAPVSGVEGWFPDPQGVAPLRYWDGAAWTSRIRMR